jgi:hypothetical protein
MFLGGGCISCFDLFALHLFWLLVIFCSCNPYLVFFLWVFYYYFCFDRLTRRFGILYIGFFGFGFCLLGLPSVASSPAFPAMLGELMWFYFAGKANH